MTFNKKRRRTLLVFAFVCLSMVVVVVLVVSGEKDEDSRLLLLVLLLLSYVVRVSTGSTTKRYCKERLLPLKRCFALQSSAKIVKKAPACPRFFYSESQNVSTLRIDVRAIKSHFQQ